MVPFTTKNLGEIHGFLCVCFGIAGVGEQGSEVCFGYVKFDISSRCQVDS